MPTTRIAIIGLCALVISGCNRPSIHHAPKIVFTFHVAPDAQTRALVRNLQPDQVTKMEITGPLYFRFENDPIKIMDKPTIKIYLDALKHAQIMTGVGAIGLADKGCQFQIYTKETVKRHEYPILLNYNPRTPYECFGPEFYRAISRVKPYPYHTVRKAESAAVEKRYRKFRGLPE